MSSLSCRFYVFTSNANISDDFYEQEESLNGVVCVFSLKNPSYPEYLCTAHCGILCVDIHPYHPHMLAVGLSDGNVAIFNLQQDTFKPAYISTAKDGKHQDIVWQVNMKNYLGWFRTLKMFYRRRKHDIFLNSLANCFLGEMGQRQS